MLLRLFFFIALFTSLFSGEVSTPFSQLALPLSQAQTTFEAIARERELMSEELADKIEEYVVQAKRTFTKVESKRRVHYLGELRSLQKKYEAVLHSLRKSVLQSVQVDDYKKFQKLLSYKLPELLEKRSFRRSVLAYYLSKKEQGACTPLEKCLQKSQLLQETENTFAKELHVASYSSKKSLHLEKKVRMEVAREHNTIDVYVVNENFYPITIAVTGKYKDVSLTHLLENEFVVGAKSRVLYEHLSVESDEASYSYDYTWCMGSKNAKHDKTYIYRLPYALGSSHRVSQGFKTETSHKGSSMYAVDFPMQVGSGVYAAREGRVVKVKENSQVGGYATSFKGSGNYVKVLHEDGTFALYYHLKYRGVLVKVGEKVVKGELIAYSGNTGYSSGPHLHFSVFTVRHAREQHSVPFSFLTENGVVDELESQKFYKAK